MSNSWIRKSRNNATVIFIHGFRSNKDECWKNENGAFWPEMISKESTLQDLGIYNFDYKTGLNARTYTISDIVDSFKESLIIDGVLNSNTLIFVCHSMGGIIARKYLVSQQTRLIEKNITDIGLFLIASPSLGSNYATMLSMIVKAFGSSQAASLKFSQDNYWLNDLDKEFLNLKNDGKIKIEGKELIEDEFYVFNRIFRGKQIVQPFSGAKYFSDPIKIPDTNHTTISKPASTDKMQHKQLKFFLENVFKTKRTITSSIQVNSIPPPDEPVSSSSSCYIPRNESFSLKKYIDSNVRAVTIKSSKKGGKTSLLFDGINYAKEQSFQVIFLDFNLIGSKIKNNKEGLLRYILNSIIEELDLSFTESSGFSFQYTVTKFLTNDVLPKIENRLILAMDNIDSLVAADYSEDIYNLFRSWYEKGSSEIHWKKFNLLLNISNDPDKLVKNRYGSPFNVGQKIILSKFTIEEFELLNSKYDSILSEMEIYEVYHYINGQPFLAQCVFYELIEYKLDWQTLKKYSLDNWNQPFLIRHLNQLNEAVTDNPDLAQALKYLLNNNQVNDSNFFKSVKQLEVMGIVDNKESNSLLICKLYQKYFSELFS